MQRFRPARSQRGGYGWRARRRAGEVVEGGGQIGDGWGRIGLGEWRAEAVKGREPLPSVFVEEWHRCRCAQGEYGGLRKLERLAEFGEGRVGVAQPVQKD